MKSSVAILPFLFLFTCAQVLAQTRILFVGNSYTAVNNLPQLVSDLSASMGDTIVFASNTPGGYTFQLHSADATTLSLIQSQPWDFVVLQEQSQRPSFPPAQVAVEVYPYARQLDSLIRLNNPCTETVFYMTWGRKYGDAANCPVWPPVCTYSGMQQQLREAYLQMGVDNAALVAPCGMAWNQSWFSDSTINLWSSDNSHPSLEGSYLNACVFYATLFRKSPVGAPFVAGLSPAIATHLQQVAHQTVLDSMPTWNIGSYDPQAAFTVQLNGLSVQFNNVSSNSALFEWDFGDGQSSNANSPQHTYAQAGLYPISLVVSNGCTSDTLVDSVGVGITALAPTENNDSCIIPMVRGFRLDCTVQSVAGYAADGRLVYTSNQALEAGQTIEFGVSNLPMLIVFAMPDGKRHAYRMINIR